MDDCQICINCGGKYPIQTHFVSVINQTTKRCAICRRKKELNLVKYNSRYIHYQLRKKQIIIESGGCAICGETEPSILEFDHIDRSKKKFHISVWYRTYKYSKQDFEDEVKNTRMLCTYDHRMHTKKQLKRNDPIVSKRSIYKDRRRKIRKQMLCTQKLMRGECEICKRKVTKAECDAFDFDHLDEYEKCANISSIYCERKWEYVLKEIKKCRLLCCHCHAKYNKTQREERLATNWHPPTKIPKIVEFKKGSLIQTKINWYFV